MIHSLPPAIRAYDNIILQVSIIMRSYKICAFCQSDTATNLHDFSKCHRIFFEACIIVLLLSQTSTSVLLCVCFTHNNVLCL